ncbi:CNH domain-containing protein [Mycena leptocephala]|nr:CNH domain-containing protein [Mycena leptocephala]
MTEDRRTRRLRTKMSAHEWVNELCSGSGWRARPWYHHCMSCYSSRTPERRTSENEKKVLAMQQGEENKASARMPMPIRGLNEHKICPASRPFREASELDDVGKSKLAKAPEGWNFLVDRQGLRRVEFIGRQPRSDPRTGSESAKLGARMSCIELKDVELKNRILAVQIHYYSWLRATDRVAAGITTPREACAHRDACGLEFYIRGSGNIDALPQDTDSLLETQGLLDPADKSPDFVLMAIYRVLNTDFLLCYDSKFPLYINKSGQRSRNEFMLIWEEKPTGFTLHRQYLVIFLPSSVQIRHIETGLVSQIIPGSNDRLLFADTPPSVNNGGEPMHGLQGEIIKISDPRGPLGGVREW